MTVISIDDPGALRRSPRPDERSGGAIPSDSAINARIENLLLVGVETVLNFGEQFREMKNECEETI